MQLIFTIVYNIAILFLFSLDFLVIFANLITIYFACF